MPDKIQKIFCDLKHRFSWGLKKWLERFPFKERKAFLSRMSWQYKEVWGNVSLSKIERNYKMEFQYFLPARCSTKLKKSSGDHIHTWLNARLTHDPRAHIHVFATFGATGRSPRRRIVQSNHCPANNVIRSYTRPRNCRQLRKPHAGFYGSVKFLLRTDKLLSCG